MLRAVQSTSGDFYPGAGQVICLISESLYLHRVQYLHRLQLDNNLLKIYYTIFCCMQVKGKNEYWIGGIITIILIFVLQALMPDWRKPLSPNRDDAELKKLRELAFDTPTYPEFYGVGETSGSRDINAHISKRYRSSASYDDVKTFYSDILLTKGWIISEERDLKSFLVTHEWKVLIFKKEDLSIHIEYKGRDSLNQQYNYSVSYSWNRK